VILVTGGLKAVPPGFPICTLTANLIARRPVMPNSGRCFRAHICTGMHKLPRSSQRAYVASAIAAHSFM
jgi:hypothetical protein